MGSNNTSLLQTSRGRTRESNGGGRLLKFLGVALALSAGVALLTGGGVRVAALLAGSRSETAAAAAAGGGGGEDGSSSAAFDWSSLEVYKSGGGGGALDNTSESLADAHQRARKAAALPKPELRSSADGMQLSSGAAAAAAACRGDGCDLVSRFVLAVHSVRTLAESGGFAVQHCPEALGIGLRPLPYSSHTFGNRCEPLYTRGAVELVRQLVGADMRGLEWFTGSSTAWFLSRLAHLTSVEAAAGFVAKARRVAEAQFEAGWLQERWDVRLMPPQGEVATFEDTESAVIFADYSGVGFVPAGAHFDVISVQGFARMACLQRAVELLRPQGGLLVLQQSHRLVYAAARQIVPAHWLRFTDSHSLGQTEVWMSLEKA